MFEKFKSFFLEPHKQETVPGCVIENGVLIAYEVTSGCCVIPEGVTELRDFAINRDRDKITEVVLPSTIRHLRQYNFSGCKNLKKINFPEGLLTIGSKALDDCDALEQVILPDSLQRVESSAFYGCDSLRQVRFGKGIRFVGEEAFAFCKSLQQVTFAKGPETIDKKAFYGCEALEEIQLPNGLRAIGDSAFAACKKLTCVHFPKSLTHIGKEAFYSAGLEAISLPKGMQYLGERAFGSCEALTQVSIPDMPAEVENYVFHHCGQITQWDVPEKLLQPRYIVEKGLLKQTLCVIDPEELRIPEGVREIGRTGVHKAAKRVILPKSLETIDSGAFDFSAIHCLELPEGVKKVGDRVFCYCFHLERVTLPDSLHTLGMGAFSKCSKLRSVRLPAGLEKLENFTFEDCKGLEEAEIPAGVKEIGMFAFKNCKKLRRVILHEGLESIGCDAFASCENLGQIHLPATLTSISLGAFSGCAALKEVTLPSGLTELRENAFAGCPITEIVIPHGITQLQQGVFAGCKELRRVVIPESVTTVSRYAFTGCAQLSQVECKDVQPFAAALLDTPFYACLQSDAHEKKRLPLHLVGSRSGKTLNDLGYSFFDPEREYNIGLPGEDGVVEVTSYAGEDGPDEDGFGREIYFDRWLLDESLEPIPGIPMWPGYSNIDMRCHAEEWKTLRRQAAATVSQR